MPVIGFDLIVHKGSPNIRICGTAWQRWWCGNNIHPIVPLEVTVVVTATIFLDGRLHLLPTLAVQQVCVRPQERRHM